MKLAALLLIPTLGLAACGSTYQNDEVARTVVAAGAGYALGQYIEKKSNDDDSDRVHRHRDRYREYCRGNRHDYDDCVPRHNRRDRK